MIQEATVQSRAGRQGTSKLIGNQAVPPSLLRVNESKRSSRVIQYPIPVAITITSTPPAKNHPKHSNHAEAIACRNLQDACSDDGRATTTTTNIIQGAE